MPGPKYNYLNVRDDLRIAEQGSGQISFRDGDLHISSSTDGQLDLTADTKLQATAPTVELEGSTLVELESTTGIDLDGDTTVQTGHTFTVYDGNTNLSGTVVLSDDLTRRNAKYISGASAALTTPGYTRCTDWLTMPDDGVMILNGKSGNLTAKLPSTPSPGKMVTFIYTHSGALTGGCNARLSGNFQVSKYAGQLSTQYYAKFSWAGDSLTLVNDGSTYYPIGVASGLTIAGPTWGTTLAV